MKDRFKFRVWNKIVNDFVLATIREDGSFSIDQNEFEFKYGDDWDYVFEEENNIIEQCTGLKDKNGKLIYDGDIVTDGQDNGRIYWENTGWACTMFLWQKKPEELKVIGNIHENKDLLK